MGKQQAVEPKFITGDKVKVAKTKLTGTVQEVTESGLINVKHDHELESMQQTAYYKESELKLSVK